MSSSSLPSPHPHKTVGVQVTRFIALAWLTNWYRVCVNGSAIINSMSDRSTLLWPGVPLAMVSAVLFGASTPLAKLLLGAGVDPWLLAGLLYLGSGLGLAVVYLVRGALAARRRRRRCGVPTCRGWRSSC